MSFEVIVHQQYDNPVIILKEHSTQTEAQIFSFGAILNKFSVQHQGQELNVIDGFTDVHEAKQTIAPAFKSAKLSPFVCRIKNEKYHFGESSFHLSKYSMGKHAIHGLVFDAVFSVIETNADDEKIGRASCRERVLVAV